MAKNNKVYSFIRIEQLFSFIRRLPPNRADGTTGHNAVRYSRNLLKKTD